MVYVLLSFLYMHIFCCFFFILLLLFTYLFIIYLFIVLYTFKCARNEHPINYESEIIFTFKVRFSLEPDVYMSSISNFSFSILLVH